MLSSMPMIIPDVSLLLGITGGKGADIVSEKIEVAGADGVEADQQEEEIIPVALSQGVAWEQENQRPDDNGDKSEDQVPGSHAALPAFGILDEPAVQQAHAHAQDLGDGHHHLVAAAHLDDHVHVAGAVHGAGLLGEEFLHQRRHRVDHKDQAQGADQVSQHPFFGGNGVGGHL